MTAEIDVTATTTGLGVNAWSYFGSSNFDSGFYRKDTIESNPWADFNGVFR